MDLSNMKSILDPSFRYIPAVETDIRKTFNRVRREQQAAQNKKVAESASKVKMLRRVVAA